MKNLNLLKFALYTLLFIFLTTCSDDETIQYQLTTEVSPEDAGTLTPATGMYNKGTEIQLKATSNEEYIFKNWSGDASGNVNPMKVIMLEDKAITAVFEKVNYTLTMDIIGEGTVNQEIVVNKSTSKDYESGTTVQLSAVPDDKWRFVEWSGDLTGNENPIQLTMDQAMSITAKFEKVSYPLTIEIEGNGTVNEEIIQAKLVSTDYESGTTVQLTAVADEGWIFTKWSGDQTSTENPLQITIESPMKIIANFEDTTQEKTYVPDDNFEKALIALGYDHVMDDYVYTQRIRNVEELRIENKEIEDLTGIEDFESLKILVVTNNELQNLDVSQNSNLEQLICDKNQLTSLDISQNLNFGGLVATENQLSCIKISPNLLWVLAWIGGPFAPWFILDEGVILSIDCSVSDEQKTYIPDDGFEQTLIEMSLDDTMDDYVKTINIINLLSLDISSKNISNLEGIQDFKGLLALDASNNNITSIPLNFGLERGSYPPAPWAGSLNLSNNNLSDLDISQLNFFRDLDVRNNPLNCIKVNENQLLYFEDAPENFELDDGVNLSTDCGN